MRAPLFDTAFELAARQVASGEVPWAVTGVAGAERVERLEAHSPAGGSRLGTTAVCLLASITKPIVATAVMSLAQQGRFPINVPLSRWVPELDAGGLRPFTAWHVMTHTSGLQEINLVDLLLAGAPREEVVRQTIALGQVSAPGSRFAYVTFSWDVLSTAVERALDRPFEDVLRAQVLDPLGMVDTGFDPTPAGSRRAPVRLGNWDGSLQDVPPGVDPERVIAAYASLSLAGGGLWSSAPDLLRFGRAMLRGGELDGVRVLGRSFVELMTREVTVGGLGANEDRLLDEHYAIGWGKPGPAGPGSPLAFQHGGLSGTRLWVDPAEDLVLVYLTGHWGAAGEAIEAFTAAAYSALG